MKNCRACKYAAWPVSDTGRRKFWGYAPCTYEVVAIVPASRWQVENMLMQDAQVREREDVPLDCAAWAKVGKEAA